MNSVPHVDEGAPEVGDQWNSSWALVDLGIVFHGVQVAEKGGGIYGVQSIVGNH